MKAAYGSLPKYSKNWREHVAPQMHVTKLSTENITGPQLSKGELLGWAVISASEWWWRNLSRRAPLPGTPNTAGRTADHSSFMFITVLYFISKKEVWVHLYLIIFNPTVRHASGGSGQEHWPATQVQATCRVEGWTTGGTGLPNLHPFANVAEVVSILHPNCKLRSDSLLRSCRKPYKQFITVNRHKSECIMAPNMCHKKVALQHTKGSVFFFKYLSLPKHRSISLYW